MHATSDHPTFTASNHGDPPWLTPDTEGNRLLNPRDQEMSPLSRNCVQHTPETVKDHHPLTTINCGQAVTNTL